MFVPKASKSVALHHFTITKHFEGKHDQRTHGSWATGKAATAIAEGRRVAENMANKVTYEENRILGRIMRSNGMSALQAGPLMRQDPRYRELAQSRVLLRESIEHYNQAAIEKDPDKGATHLKQAFDTFNAGSAKAVGALSRTNRWPEIESQFDDFADDMEGIEMAMEELGLSD